MFRNKKTNKKELTKSTKGSQFGEDYKNNTKYLFSPEV